MASFKGPVAPTLAALTDAFAAIAFEGKWPSGSYLQSDGTLTTGAPALDRLCFSPLWVPEARTISEVACETTVASAATGVIRTGLYAPDANGRPGALLADFGTIDAAATAGILSKTGLSLAVTRGLYWRATATQVTVTSLTMRLIAGAPNRFVNKTTVTAGSSFAGPTYNQDSVTGAFPASATPVLTNGAVNAPIWFPKAA